MQKMPKNYQDFIYGKIGKALQNNTHGTTNQPPTTGISQDYTKEIGQFVQAVVQKVHQFGNQCMRKSIMKIQRHFHKKSSNQTTDDDRKNKHQDKKPSSFESFLNSIKAAPNCSVLHQLMHGMMQKMPKNYQDFIYGKIGKALQNNTHGTTNQPPTTGISQDYTKEIGQFVQAVVQKVHQFGNQCKRKSIMKIQKHCRHQNSSIKKKYNENKKKSIAWMMETYG